MILEGKRVLVTGGTGSLGHRVVHRILTSELGRPSRVTVFSRDEAKQHYMRLAFLARTAATDDVIYADSRELLNFRIGDVRDYAALLRAVREADIIFHAAALKQVPACEYFPFEAVQTNIVGAQNLVRAVLEGGSRVEAVIGISTDKACKPVNVMGMTKAMMERILVQANQDSRGTRFGCVRYGNVIASRGSVVPLFVDQCAKGGPVTITLAEMTRFLLSLDDAVDTVFAALQTGRPGETYVPIAPAARVVDVAKAIIGDRPIDLVYSGIRPGEKIHEIMISEEECYRTSRRDAHYIIHPMLPELRAEMPQTPALDREFSSERVTLDGAALDALLAPYINAASPAHDLA